MPPSTRSMFPIAPADDDEPEGVSPRTRAKAIESKSLTSEFHHKKEQNQGGGQETRLAA